MRAITGSCRFLALFQREMAASVDIPVFSSSLIQVPLAYHMTGGSAPVGILTADKTALSSAHLKAVGAEEIPVVDFRYLYREIQRNLRIVLVIWTIMEIKIIETFLFLAGNVHCKAGIVIFLSSYGLHGHW